MRTEPNDAAHGDAQPDDKRHDGTVEEIDALVETGNDHACERSDGRCDEDGYEDIGGLGCPCHGTVSHHADRDNGQSAGIEHEEHDHGVGGGVFLLVEFLHTLHGFESKGSGCVVETQHVGAEVHEDVAENGVPCGNLREESHHEGREPSRQSIHQSAFLAYLHDAHPQG